MKFTDSLHWGEIILSLGRRLIPLKHGILLRKDYSDACSIEQGIADVKESILLIKVSHC